MDLITVDKNDSGGFSIQVRGHEVPVDMPAGEGGSDSGPSPVELLAGSLGACISMMVQSYCDTHGYSDGNVSASLTIQLADKPKRVA